MNEVDLRLHQNTSQFVSKGGNKQGAIGTTTVVPYSLLQIHGWVNPKSAQKTDLSVQDVLTMQKAFFGIVLMMQILVQRVIKVLYYFSKLFIRNNSEKCMA